jgi:hypothetical protein
VVADLVDDGTADLLGDFLLAMADRANGLAVDGDPVPSSAVLTISSKRPGSMSITSSLSVRAPPAPTAVSPEPTWVTAQARTCQVSCTTARSAYIAPVPAVPAIPVEDALGAFGCRAQ